MTSKQDFDAVAQAIRHEVAEARQGQRIAHKAGNPVSERISVAEEGAVRRVADSLAYYFAACNRRFNRDRFLRACGFENDEPQEALAETESDERAI